MAFNPEVPASLKSCHSIQQFDCYLNRQAVQTVALYGSRRFIFENGENVSEKKIIKQFKRILKNETPSSFQVQKIMIRIDELSLHADDKLEQSIKDSFPLKVSSFIKKAFGNGFYDKERHKNEIMQGNYDEESDEWVSETYSDFESYYTYSIEESESNDNKL